MRPHEGIGAGLAHQAISTGVLAHTLSFHEPVRATDWHLLAQRGTYAGGGRSYGRGEVFTQDGRLVASFVQDSMVRSFGDTQTARGSGILTM
jgi:acyl-CoA thioesterase II